jgi:transcriptional regulator GlxA family with amidase domain
MRTRSRRIGILIFDGMTALDVVGPADAFASAGSAAPAYEVVTIGLTRQRCVAESGLLVQPSHTIDDALALDTLLVPGGSGLRERRVNRRAANWIGERARHVRRIASVCTGIYGIAPTGLLDGRRVTTHWRFAEDVATRFPKLKVCANDLFIKDGAFYTSAGVTAGIDLSLSLIEEDLGSSAALAVARELVVYMRRDGGQAQFSEPLRFQSSAPDRFSNLAAYIAAHLDGDLSVDVLARKMAVSPRQLNRQCNDVLGCSPAELVQRIRLDEAKSRLLRRETTVSVVAESLGIRSADVFRRAFERRFGINPSAYRARFPVNGESRVPARATERGER